AEPDEVALEAVDEVLDPGDRGALERARRLQRVYVAARRQHRRDHCYRPDQGRRRKATSERTRLRCCEHCGDLRRVVDVCVKSWGERAARDLPVPGHRSGERWRGWH